MSDPIFSVRGKVCLVTGVSTGLGGYFARLMLSRGARVVGIARTEIDWEAGDFESHFDNLFGDLREEETIDRVIDHLKEQYGRVDILINNAGVSRIERAMDFSYDGLRDIVDINVISAGLVGSKAAALMREVGNGGSIINVTSVMAQSSLVGLSAYSATKAALSQLTHGMAVEWARYGIRVNNLAPGWFPTPMTTDHLDRGMSQVLKTRIPMKRLGEPQELDGACLLLASEASRYITGSTITVDGGFSLIN